MIIQDHDEFVGKEFKDLFFILAVISTSALDQLDVELGSFVRVVITIEKEILFAQADQLLLVQLNVWLARLIDGHEFGLRTVLS